MTFFFFLGESWIVSSAMEMERCVCLVWPLAADHAIYSTTSSSKVFYYCYYYYYCCYLLT